METIEWDFREAEAIRNASDEVVEDFDDAELCDEDECPVDDGVCFIDEDIEEEVDETSVSVDDK